MNYINDINNIMQKIREVINFVKVSLLVTLIFIVILDLLANLSHIGGFLNTICISLLSSGILLNLVPWVINKNIDIANILLFEQTLSDFIKNIIFDILEKFNYYGTMFVIIGIIGILVSSCCKENE